ncbi:nuclear pore complex protein Nup133-like protein [Leptotrombidium deliense]|uniref:Nuclear pore complex protein Nup133-like protein n=1 Tax=Leptotrombidium deliense TaxID=299467 RepID=A0A443STD0_9ACAR|nr:nuclear pore complex protein Nup133-like protein [Leptotrombidium deliense]
MATLQPRKMFKKHTFSSNSKNNSSLFKTKNVTGSGNHALNQCSFSIHSENTSQSIIAESNLHSLRNYGSVLPVLVIEAISSEVSSRNAVSVKLSESGWVWLVCGRRVFVWKFKRSSLDRSSTCTCFELLLPPSDLSHKADLICLLENGSNQIPGLIATSPEGIVRYWPSIAYDGHSIETSVIDLQGQECFSLTNVQPLGCILGTTTSSLVHIAINSVDATNILVCRTLKVPQGMFLGLSRKVSSFIFGSTPASHSSESRSLIKVLKDASSNNETFVYVLSSSLLQKWIILSAHSEALLLEYDLDRSLRDAFLNFGVWNCETTHPNQLHIWQIDFEIRNENELLLFVAGLNSDVSSQLYYALVVISSVSNSARAPFQLKSFTCLKNYPVYYSHEEEEKLLNLKIVNIPEKNIAYVYSPYHVLCVQCKFEYDYVFTGFKSLVENDVLDVIDVRGKEDIILGAGVCDNTPILFTSKDGLVCLVSSENFTISAETGDVSLNDLECIGTDDDMETILFKAFSFFRKKENSKCQSIISEHVLKNSSLIDDAVMKVSSRLCNESPQSDPRWAEVDSSTTNLTIVSKLILDQLEEKLKVYESFIDFLRATKVWDILTVIVLNGVSLSTPFVLYEYLEKLVLALSLKRLNDDLADILNPAIKTLLEKREVEVSSRLTLQDVFYKDATRVNDLFPIIIELEEKEIVNSLALSKHVLHIILSICNIFVTSVQDVYKYRQKAIQLFNFSCTTSSDCSLWTTSLTSGGVGSCLLRQFEILVDYGINAKFSGKSVFVEESIQTKNAVNQNLVDLVDVILEGYVYQLNCLQKDTDKYRAFESVYDNERKRLIEPLIMTKQYERAVSLAEKYEEFDALIRVCEEIDNKDRLQRYMSEFSHKGFSDHLFKWYMKQGQFGKMLSTSSADLGDFLKDYKSLQWIHEIGTNRFGDASVSLKSLAHSVNNDIPKKRTLLSLGKLCAIANGEEIDTVREDFSELETLPLFS